MRYECAKPNKGQIDSGPVLVGVARLGDSCSRTPALPYPGRPVSLSPSPSP